ncbi:MAG: PIG-L family deacetylase [Verrucomicrobiota bacterium]
MSSAEPLRLLLIVAHPDDAEARCGGLMSIYRQAGHAVKWISVTNGDAGHHLTSGPPLAKIREQESAQAAAVITADYEVWDAHDGQLEATLEMRWQVIRAIRTFKPDLVLTHRTCDYHPDHRAVAQLVQDASFSVTVPAIVPDTPALPRDPVIAYMADLFTRPTPLRPDVVIDVDEHHDTIIEMFSCHVSQAFEWLPYNWGIADTVPDDAPDRKKWMEKHYMPRLYGAVAESYRQQLIDHYGEKQGRHTEYAEVYEISEYACQLDEEKRSQLFWFLK